MRKKLWICLALVFILPGLLLTVSCSTTGGDTQTEETPAETPEEEAAPVEQPPVIQPEDAPTPVTDTRDMNAEQIFYNEHVYFEYDKSTLTPYAQEVLTRKAEFMNENADVYISIEGHCDERGTNEYNLSLGDKRAAAVKAYLVDLGVSANRVSTVSYGEERPADDRSSEEAWSKNRRGVAVSD